MTEREGKFKKLAEKRVNNAIKQLKLVGILSNKNNYTYTDEQAKRIFASGMSFYVNGIFNLVDTGINVSQIIGNFAGGIAGVIQGIGLAFIAKDSLTALPLFFNSTGIIFDYANQSGIEDLDDLEKAKDSLGF